MRLRSRRTSALAVTAIAGVGLPLLIASAASAPAVAAVHKPVLKNYARTRAAADKIEKQMERKGFQTKRAAYFDSRRFSGTKPLSIVQAAKDREAAVRAAQRLPRAGAQAHTYAALTAAPVGPMWQSITPPDTFQAGRTTGNFENVSGRVSAIAIDNEGRVFAGAAQGGVWRYDPNTQEWTSLTDNLSSLAVGAIAIAPDNDQVIYLGAGEGDLSGDSYFGDGIYKSTDGGDTWSHVNAGPQFVGASVAKIVVDPTNNNVLYAATIQGVGGANFVRPPSPQRWGVYKSTDGGSSWTALRTTTDRHKAPTDLALDPVHHNTLYATFWSDGIYKTMTVRHRTVFRKIMLGLPSADHVANQTRFSISAVPYKNTTRLYAGFDWLDKGGNYHPSRIFRSDNAGATWRQTGTSGPLGDLDSVLNYCDIQCSYDNVVVADPANPNTVYVAGEYNYPLGAGGVYRSDDAGKTWLNLGVDLHPDFHALALQPNDTKHVAIGNDGGVWQSSNQGGRHDPITVDEFYAGNSDPNNGPVVADWQNLNEGLVTTQFTNVDYSDNGPFGFTTAYGGTQDNGTQINLLGVGFAVDIGLGDGGFAIVDHKNPQYVYGTHFDISPYRFDDGGVTDQGFFDVGGYTPITRGLNTHDRSEFYVPWLQNQLHTNQMFLGTYRLYRTNNAEAPDANDVTWTPISDDLTTGCTGKAPNGSTGCLISAVGLADGGSGVYVGTDDGLVQVSPDATTSDNPTWVNRTASNLPNRPVSAFAVDRSNWRTAFVSYGGYNAATPTTPGHVFATTDGGQNWTDVSGTGGAAPLPDNPVNSLVLDPSDPNTLFAVTDVGTFVTHDGGSNWQQLAGGMPTVAVMSVQDDPATGTIYAATHGRGQWTLDTGSSRPALVASTSDSGAPVGPGTTIDYTLTVQNIGNADAVNGTVTQPVPANTSYVDSSADQGGALDGNNVVWSNLSIPAGGETTLHYSVTIDPNLDSAVKSIVSDGLQVTAQDAAANDYATSGSPYETPIAPALAVSVTPKAQTLAGNLGDVVDYTYTVTNRGYTPDTYDVSATGDWSAAVYESDCTTPLTDTGVVDRGETKTVCLAVTVPNDAAAGDRNTETLTAVSEADSSVTDSATAVTVPAASDTLVVDQDGSKPGGSVPDAQGAYVDALTAAGHTPDVWDIAVDGPLTQAFLNAHKNVYWETGISYPNPLSAYQDELQNFLDAGNSLFVSGQDILDQTGGQTSFVHDYLHIDWDGSERQNDKPTFDVHGVDGSVIGDGLGAIALNQPAAYGQFEDEITPINGADPQFQDDGSQTDGLAVSDTTTGANPFKVVFLAYPLENLGTAQDRANVLGRVATFFGS